MDGDDEMRFCPGCEQPQPMDKFLFTTVRGKKQRRRLCRYCLNSERRIEHHAATIPKRREYAVTLGIGARACVMCRRDAAGWEYVRAKGSNGTGGTVRVSVSDECDVCYNRKRREHARTRAVAIQSLASVDWTRLAEQACFPGVAYMTMTRDQRLWTYVVARRWWLAAGNGTPFAIDVPQEVQRLDSLERALWSRGAVCPVPPTPDTVSRYADDHVDDHARAVRPAHDDGHGPIHGHPTPAQAEGGRAAVA